MTKITVTPLQAKLLNAIARSEYTNVNGAVPKSIDDCGEVWAKYIINTASRKGVATSLINAGLIGVRQETKMDNTVWLTEAGFAAWQASRAKVSA